MSAPLVAEAFSGALAQRLRTSRQGGMTLFWLGQAGFVLDAGDHRILIDPYLSDTLEAKYAGTAHPHARMMPAPATVADLGRIDLVLCTHQHTDHMDPGTLIPLARANPACRFVVPAAALSQALERTGANIDRLILADAGETIAPLPGLRITPVRAAHETLERDEMGRYRFLGYGVAGAGAAIFHAGDTIPFDGQIDEVAALEADLALLPVNGRSAAMRAAGFAGNLTLDEAMALASATGIRAMIAHHYGLFAFNTADPAVIDAAHPPEGLSLFRAKTGVAYRFAR